MEASQQYAVEWELTRLVSSFSHFIDHRRYDELVALFSEDGSFDRVGQILQGRAAILEAMHNRHPLLTRHCITNLLFTRVTADEAEATMYCANFVGESGPEGQEVGYALPQPAFLEFDDLYRRTPEGWRIAKRVARVIIKPAQAQH